MLSNAHASLSTGFPTRPPLYRSIEHFQFSGLQTNGLLLDDSPCKPRQSSRQISLFPSSQKCLRSRLRHLLRFLRTFDLLPLSPLPFFPASDLSSQYFISLLACCLRSHGVGFVLGWDRRHGRHVFGSLRCHFWSAVHANTACWWMFEVDRVPARVSDSDGIRLHGEPSSEVVATRRERDASNTRWGWWERLEWRREGWTQRRCVRRWRSAHRARLAGIGWSKHCRDVALVFISHANGACLHSPLVHAQVRAFSSVPLHASAWRLLQEDICRRGRGHADRVAQSRAVSTELILSLQSTRFVRVTRDISRCSEDAGELGHGLLSKRVSQYSQK